MPTIGEASRHLSIQLSSQMGQVSRSQRWALLLLLLLTLLLLALGPLS